MPGSLRRVRNSQQESALGGRTSLAGTVALRTCLHLLREGKGVEDLVAIEGVGVLSPLEPVNNEVRQGGSENLVPYFKGVAGRDHVSQRGNGYGPPERKRNDDGGIDCLSDDGRADGAGPQHASVSEKLEP